MRVRRWKRSLSSLIIAALIATLFPVFPQTAEAAPNLEIQYWTVSATKPANPSTVTSKFVDIEVDYTQIADDDLLKLYYEIENVSTGIKNVVKDNAPDKTGSQRVVFRNVELSEGLNKITVILDSVSQPRSLPAWIYFTEVATVTNLTVDNEIFVNGAFVPEDNRSGSQNYVFINGVAPNATSVTGYTVLQPGGQRANYFFPATGEFSFTAGASNNAELRLRPGDNELTIIAANPFKTYRSERTFVYNNGEAFFYNTKAARSSGADLNNPDTNMLFKQPTFQANAANGTYEIDITTDVKINRNGTDMTHNGIELEINDNSKIYTVSFGTPNIAAKTVTYSVYGHNGGLTVNNATLNFEMKDDYFLIKDVTIPNVELDMSKSDQLLEVAFQPLGSYAVETQEFLFFYKNELDPYVARVLLGATNTELYSGIEVTINLEEVEFLVEAKNGAQGVNVYMPGKSSSPVASASGTKTVSGTTYFVVTLSQQDLPEGRSLLRFVPTGAGGQEYPVGAREYLINYNPSPYVFLTNVYNGQVFNDIQNQPVGYNSNGSTFNGPVFQIRPVNIPEDQFSSIRVSLNDNMDIIRPGDRYPSSGTFQEFRFFFGTAGTRPDWKLVNGKNILKIEVFSKGKLDSNGNPIGGAEPITTFQYELFYFTDDVPEVVDLDLEKDFAKDYQFTRLEGQTFRYYTQETKLKFAANFVNAETVKIIVNTRDEDGEAVRYEAELRWKPSSKSYDIIDGDNIIDRVIVDPDVKSGAVNGSGQLISETLDLFGAGLTTIEVQATNSSGLFNTRFLEVQREPASFVVHYPRIDPDTKIGTINGNYARLYVEAEGADRIIYDKNKEISKTKTVRINGEDRELFVFEVKGLKRGNNKVKFTVMRGDQKEEAEITLVNADTIVPGAEFKESIQKGTIKAFNRQFELKFPKGTIVRRNDERAPDQALSPTRDILVGIADPIDGRVNKTLHPFPGEKSIFSTKNEWSNRYMLLQEPTGRFRQVSPLFWVDAGIVPLSGTQEEVLYGSGIYPYERDQEFYTRNANNVDEQFVPSQPGELTLAYDPNMVHSSWRYVTVYHYGYNEDHLGNKRYEWKNLGGVVNPKNNTITVPFEEFGYYVVMYMDQSFDDIVGHPWARDYLDTLYSKGIMKPKEASRFETNIPITRGEFTTMIVKAYSLPLNYDGRATFSDVRQVDPLSDGLYEYKYIETAARAGIVRGTLGNRFSPAANITREQAAAIIARAAGLKLDPNTDKVRAKLQKKYTDVDKMDDYALAAILAVTDKGLMSGKPNVTGSGNEQTFYFDPKANMTRAEAASVIIKVLEMEKKIPR